MPAAARVRAVRSLSALVCAAILGGSVRTHAADDAAAAPRETKSTRESFASSWSWNEGLHYGIDVPDVGDTWDTGELRWRPLLRGTVGLRLAIDAAGVFQGGRGDDQETDVGARRSYLYGDGNVTGFRKPVSYKFEVGTVDGRFSLRNASIAVHDLPYAGTLRMGAFDAPMSLSMLTSSRATPLMERGLAVEAFAPGTLAGIGLTNHLARERIVWAVGTFGEGRDADVGDSSQAAARLIGRLVWLPWRRPEDLLHVGASTSWAFSPADTIRFASRPESFFAPEVADTGDIDAGQSVVVGLEAVWVRDRLSVQGEHLHAIVLRDGPSNLSFRGSYGMASWFLTNDRRTYDDGAAAFGSLVPSRPVSWRKRQLGALEIAARWSLLDLVDGGVRGGRVSELMGGINWYLNRWVRLQVNVGWSHAVGGPRPGDAAVLQTRFDLLV